MSVRSGGERSQGADHDDVRCDCGALLARAIPGGIEVKCRRCRRSVVLDQETVNSAWRRLEL